MDVECQTSTLLTTARLSLLVFCNYKNRDKENTVLCPENICLTLSLFWVEQLYRCNTDWYLVLRNFTV